MPKDNSVQIGSHSPFLFPRSDLSTSTLLFTLIDLPLLNISCKWNNIICGFFHLASYIWYYIFKVYLCCNMFQYLIHFYGWIIFHYIDTSNYLFPFIDYWIFELFTHFLVIMNNADMTIYVQVFLWMYVISSLVYILRVEMLAQI